MNRSADLALHYVLHELIHVTQAGELVVYESGIQTNTANPVEGWTSRMAEALAAAGGQAYRPEFIPPGYESSPEPLRWGPVGPAAYVPPQTFGT